MYIPSTKTTRRKISVAEISYWPKIYIFLAEEATNLDKRSNSLTGTKHLSTLHCGLTNFSWQIIREFFYKLCNIHYVDFWESARVILKVIRQSRCSFQGALATSSKQVISQITKLEIICVLVRARSVLNAYCLKYLHIFYTG